MGVRAFRVPVYVVFQRTAHGSGVSFLFLMTCLVLKFSVRLIPFCILLFIAGERVAVFCPFIFMAALIAEFRFDGKS